MSRTTVVVRDSFDSAHFLPKVPDGHKCARMHGHTYRIKIAVSGPVDPVSGWVIDYADVKAEWCHLKGNIDHCSLNDVLENPTCENIAQWIADRLEFAGVVVSWIDLRETVNCGVVWER